MSKRSCFKTPFGSQGVNGTIILKAKKNLWNFYCISIVYMKFIIFWKKNTSIMVSVFAKLLALKDAVT